MQSGTFIYKPGISVTKQDFHLQMGSLGLQMGFSGYYLPLLQFYRLKTGINKEAEEIFVTAYDEYRNVRFPENNSIAIKHLFYAKLYCRQKANLAIFYQSEDKKGYDVDKLSEECEDLITYFPEFSNLYVLLGMICEKNYEYTKIKAMNAYRACNK